MRGELLHLVEEAARTDRSAPVWAGGRYVEEWVAPALRDELAATFAQYDATDLRRALVALTDLFERLAGDVATATGCTYPTRTDAEIRRWVTATIDPVGGAGSGT